MRLESLHLSENMTLKNRLVVPPMASGTANSDGSVSERTMGHYARLTRSGAGLIFVEYTYVHRSGRSEDNQLGADRDDNIRGLAKIATQIKRSGAVPALQLTHAGGKSSPELTGGELIGPSDGTVPVFQIPAYPMRAMTIAEIKCLQQSFVMAALRAQSAGFQIIELHVAHGYGLNQWISPLTNHRTDAYGGSLENRARMLLEIVGEIRKATPDMVISVRFPGGDSLPGGLTIQDAATLAIMLENTGVGLFNVSSGIGGWRRPPNFRGEGYLVQEAAQIRKSVNTPVIGVGGIKSVEFIEAALFSKKVDLVGVGRAILENPEGFSETFILGTTGQSL